MVCLAKNSVVDLGYFVALGVSNLQIKTCRRKKMKIFLVDHEPLTGKLMLLICEDFLELKNVSTFEPYQSQGYVITV